MPSTAIVFDGFWCNVAAGALSMGARGPWRKEGLGGGGSAGGC